MLFPFHFFLRANVLPEKIFKRKGDGGKMGDTFLLVAVHEIEYEL